MLKLGTWTTKGSGMEMKEGTVIRSGETTPSEPTTPDQATTTKTKETDHFVTNASVIIKDLASFVTYVRCTLTSLESVGDPTPSELTMPVQVITIRMEGTRRIATGATIITPVFANSVSNARGMVISQRIAKLPHPPSTKFR
jgi:hypothetical protein